MFERWGFGSRGRRIAAIAGVFFLSLTANWISAGPAAAALPPADLREEILDDYEVLTLSSGIVLRPRADEDFETIEFAGDAITVDGTELAGDDLRDRVGRNARYLEQLSGMSSEERVALFSGVAEESESRRRSARRSSSAVPAPPAPPGVPEAPEPPTAPRAPRHSRVRSDAKVAVGSSVVVDAGEVAEDVVSIGGSVTVEEGAEVEGDAVAVGGGADILGRVTGEVVAVGGSVELGPNAEVFGDVTSVGGQVEQHETSRVEGQVHELPFGPMLGLGWLGAVNRAHDLAERVEEETGRSFARRFGRIFSKLLSLVAVALLACLALLVARRPVERIGARIEAEPWRAGLVGLLAEILFVPLLILVVFVLAISIIGIPLLVLVPFAILALVLGSFLGYVAVAERVGRWAERRFGWRVNSVYMTLAIGVGLLYAFALIGRILDLGGGPLHFFAMLCLFVGGLVQYLSWTVGLGGALITRLGTQDDWTGWRRRVPVVPPPPPPAPPEPDALGSSESEPARAE